jgi:membrane protease subunit HflK
MFQPIFDFIALFWDYLKMYWIIEDYNKGVVLRWGRFNRVMEPGFSWKWPFAEVVLETTIVPTTMRLSAQSLKTIEGEPIVCESVIKYEVRDVRTLLLKVYDATDAIVDMTQAIIKSLVLEKTWDECRTAEMDSAITRKARVEAKKWGIEIIQVTIVSIAKAPTVRLLGATINT